MVQETVQTEGLQVGLQWVLLQEEAHLVFASQISDSLIEQRFHSSWGEVNKFMNIQTGSCWVNKESQIRLEAKLRLKSRTQLSPILESKKSNHQRMNGAWPDWTHNTAESYNPHNALESLCFYPFCFVLFCFPLGIFFLLLISCFMFLFSLPFLPVGLWCWRKLSWKTNNKFNDLTACVCASVCVAEGWRH